MGERDERKRTMKTVRCTSCRSEFTDAEIASATACPGCGSRGVPMSIAKDRMVTINEHELRILTIWASNWVETIPVDERRQSAGALRGILARLREQLPGVALTMGDEMQALADVTGSRVDLVKGGETTKTVEPKKPS